MSNYYEERKNYSKSPLEEISKELKTRDLQRPMTAKRSEFENSLSQKRYLSKFNPAFKRPKTPKKGLGSIFMMKLKANKIPVEKERLYMENIELKMKNNLLNEKLIKLKSKLSQIEREKQRKSENSISPTQPHSSYLVNLLKQNIKDLKLELENKNLEIANHKKKMKLTKFVEMEFEIKAYIDECTRLRHYIEEVLKNKDGINRDFSGQSLDTKSMNLLKIIEDNHKEIQSLKDQLEKESIRNIDIDPKIQEKVFELKNEIKDLRNELYQKEKFYNDSAENLKKEAADTQGQFAHISFKLQAANTLIENLYKELKSLRQKKMSYMEPPRCFKILNEIAVSQEKSISDYLNNFVSKNASNNQKLKKINKTTLVSILKEYDNTITNQEIDNIVKYTQGQVSSEISIKRLIKYLNTFDYKVPKDTPKELPDLLEHLSLRMQLHRIPKKDLIESLLKPGSMKIDLQQIIILFTNPPFNFRQAEAVIISEYFFDSKSSLDYYDFSQNFYKNLKDWEIFTPKDEENFDSYLQVIVSNNFENLQRDFKSKDPQETGVISLQEFNDVIKSNKINFPERVNLYLLVLFYSHNMQLNSAPYKQFFEAYSTDAVGSVSSEENKVNLAQEYLLDISQRLVIQNKSVREAFNHDKNGYILAEDFSAAVKMLGMNEIPRESLVILLETLQKNLEERVLCIHIEDLEDILENYGVPITQSLHSICSQESFTGDSVGHVQKVSLLDSIQLDILETTKSN
jgi:hypothetical protein